MADSGLFSNLKCKRPWQEASGALGDLGTFVPIVVALTLVNNLDVGTSLIATGLYNLFTGFMFGVPMPVQPMKSIAAVAITQGDTLTIPQIMAAGMCVSGVTLALGLTGLIRLVAWIVPLPVVRGIQLAQGLSFATTAVKYVLREQDFAKGKATGDRPWLGLDGLVVALLAMLFIILTNGSGEGLQSTFREVDEEPEPTSRRTRFANFIRKVPTALIVFVAGIILAVIRKPSIFKEMSLGPSRPQVTVISWEDLKVGFVRGAIPQLPLTILNSVVAVCKLSNDLFPSKDQVSPTKVSVSVGLMNLIGCWFGALPVCHGAGGLAGQYRFGATTGASVAMLGLAKLVLGLLIGNSLIQLLTVFPIGLLGVLLLISGVELAMACRDQSSRMDSFVMLTCVAVSQGSDLATGCVCSIVLFAVLKLRELEFRVREAVAEDQQTLLESGV